ncbi:DUF2510 domain-containing protein [Diaminobutyricibacter sp. McL0618]|uniref:DUF2510 domain-containing protein n=1 Tax=Leifsonia sp. McL0618 TaxID=3415677 RepID=UPI003CF38A4B
MRLGVILSIGTTPTIPAGWYQDPSTSDTSARRWWDGVHWTSYVSSVTPPTPFAPSEQQSHGITSAQSTRRVRLDCACPEPS